MKFPKPCVNLVKFQNLVKFPKPGENLVKFPKPGEISKVGQNLLKFPKPGENLVKFLKPGENPGEI